MGAKMIEHFFPQTTTLHARTSSMRPMDRQLGTEVKLSSDRRPSVRPLLGDSSQPVQLTCVFAVTSRLFLSASFQRQRRRFLTLTNVPASIRCIRPSDRPLLR